MYDIVIVVGDKIIGVVAGTDCGPDAAKTLLAEYREAYPRPFGEGYQAVLHKDEKSLLCNW